MMVLIMVIERRHKFYCRTVDASTISMSWPIDYEIANAYCKIKPNNQVVKSSVACHCIIELGNWTKIKVDHLIYSVQLKVRWLYLFTSYVFCSLLYQRQPGPWATPLLATLFWVGHQLYAAEGRQDTVARRID